MLGTKRSRSPGHTHARTRRAYGTFFLPLHLTRHSAPARLSARTARRDHPSLRITAALGACPGDRRRAPPGPFPPLLLLQKTLPLSHPGPFVVPPYIYVYICIYIYIYIYILRWPPTCPWWRRLRSSCRPSCGSSPRACRASAAARLAGPPLRGEHAVRRVLPVSQPHDPDQDQFRRVLTEALAPGRLAAYARVVPTDECQARLRVAERSDQLFRWMRFSCYEAQEDVSRLLQAWVARACPESQDLTSFSRHVVSELALQKHCTLPELLLLSDVVATVSHLARSGRPLYDSFEELAQVSHLLARWHMPDHRQTRRGSTTWLQWMAVVAPALWLTLLWAMQLRGGVQRRRRAKRGVRSLHPLIQFALSQGSDAGPRVRGALDEFLARQ